mgnify:CR=1 FL=1
MPHSEPDPSAMSDEQVSSNPWDAYVENYTAVEEARLFGRLSPEAYALLRQGLRTQFAKIHFELTGEADEDDDYDPVRADAESRALTEAWHTQGHLGIQGFDLDEVSIAPVVDLNALHADTVGFPEDMADPDAR